MGRWKNRSGEQECPETISPPLHFMDVRTEARLTGGRFPLSLCYTSLHLSQYLLRTEGGRSEGEEKGKTGGKGSGQKVGNQH